MKSNRFSSLLLAGMGAVATVAPAVQGAQLTVDFDPPNNIGQAAIQVGQSGTAAISISDFRPAASAISAFDFVLLYDPAVILADALVFGSSLDGGDPLNVVSYIDLTTPGVAIGQVSVLDKATLEGLQADSFLLASITFHGVAPGTTSFSLDPSYANAAADAEDDPSSISLTLNDNKIVVQEKPSNGNLPDAGSTLAMLAGGLILGAPLLRRAAKR